MLGHNPGLSVPKELFIIHFRLFPLKTLSYFYKLGFESKLRRAIVNSTAGSLKGCMSQSS